MHSNDNHRILSSYVIDGVEVTIDENGNEHFKQIEEKQNAIDENANRSFFSRIINWLKHSPIVPYAKVRNLSDPLDKLDIDDGSSRYGIEAGIKIKF